MRCRLSNGHTHVFLFKTYCLPTYLHVYVSIQYDVMIWWNRVRFTPTKIQMWILLRRWLLCHPCWTQAVTARVQGDVWTSFPSSVAAATVCLGSTWPLLNQFFMIVIMAEWPEWLSCHRWNWHLVGFKQLLWGLLLAVYLRFSQEGWTNPLRFPSAGAL